MTPVVGFNRTTQVASSLVGIDLLSSSSESESIITRSICGELGQSLFILLTLLVVGY